MNFHCVHLRANGSFYVLHMCIWLFIDNNVFVYRSIAYIMCIDMLVCSIW